ncbi:Emopamil-binding protein [Xylogone sp. PMI_703]|nr:Emopamil-binding protein [Xylogone sp. PMI_703]
MSSPPDLFDQTTLISLSAVLVFLFSSYFLSQRVLARNTPTSLRVLFIWHAFDVLIHTILEGSFLYNCFTVYRNYDPAIDHPASVTNFLSRPDRVYGSAYGDNWAAQLWQIYARADKRWGGADLTVISLELLTVFGGAPLAAYICYGIAKKDPRVSFWMIVLATAELYGGFMTFCPEWLTGNVNLDTSNWMYKWLYLVFFNMLWVFAPIYAMYVAYRDISNAFLVRNGVMNARMALEREEAKKLR